MLHFPELRARFERQMADYLADVGRRLRDARLRNRPDLDSIPKAARELQDKHGIDISEKQYGRWERGESEPRGSKRDALAAMLGIRKEEIWGEAPIAPEEELRAQLNRIEETLAKILAEQRLIRLELKRPSRQRRTPPPAARGKAASGS